LRYLRYLHWLGGLSQQSWWFCWCINLNTTQNTKIKGANLQATNQLNLNTKNLEVSSVQNKHKDAWC
jgi:uncharacterized protein YmfQ (DUF2313 family)